MYNQTNLVLELCSESLHMEHDHCVYATGVSTSRICKQNITTSLPFELVIDGTLAAVDKVQYLVSTEL